MRESQSNPIAIDNENLSEGDEEIFWRQYLKGIIPLSIKPLNPYSSVAIATKASLLRCDIFPLVMKQTIGFYKSFDSVQIRTVSNYKWMFS